VVCCVHVFDYTASIFKSSVESITLIKRPNCKQTAAAAYSRKKTAGDDPRQVEQPRYPVLLLPKGRSTLPMFTSCVNGPWTGGSVYHFTESNSS